MEGLIGLLLVVVAFVALRRLRTQGIVRSTGLPAQSTPVTSFEWLA